MKLHFFRYKGASQRGLAIPLFLISLIGLLFLLGLVIDISNLYHAQIRLQRSVDGAALASAKLQHKPIDINSSQQRQELIDNIEWVAKEVVKESLAAQNYQPHQYDMPTYVSAHFPSSTMPAPGTTVRGPHTIVRAHLKPNLYLLNLLPDFISNPILTAEAEAEARSAIISVILDISGSMNSNMGGIKKIDALKQAAKQFVNLLRNSRDIVSLTTFSDRAQLRVAANDYWDTSSQINNHRNTLVNTIEAINAGGWTNSSESLFIGWQSIKDQVATYPFLPCFVVFFTDGAPNHSSVNWVKPQNNSSNSFVENPSISDANHSDFWYTYKSSLNVPINYWYRSYIDSQANYRFDPFCPLGSGSRCSGPNNLRFTDVFKNSHDLEFRVPGRHSNDNIDGRKYTLFRAPNTNDRHNTQLRQLHYLTAIAMSDYIRFKGCTVFSIGLGQLEDDFSKFYQTISDDMLRRKDYFLSRVANDSTCGDLPQIQNSPGGCLDLPISYGIETYQELEEKNVSKGNYYPTDDPNTLTAIFREILANIRLRINQ